MIAIYGDPYHSNNFRIWNEIKSFIQMEQKVCVIGDFNSILRQQDKFGGNQNFNSNNKGFRDFIADMGFIDLDYKGLAYTWTNKQNASNAIFQRLDRALVSVSWFTHFNQAYVNNLPRIYSDHAPIMLNTEKYCPPYKQFRIENWWFKEEGFKEACHEFWESTQGQQWDQRWKKFRLSVRNWTKKLQTPQNKIKQLETQILNFQSLSPELQNPQIENDLQRQYEEAEDQLEDYWRQRAKLNCDLYGDKNKKFFYIVASQRKQQNQILTIQNEQDQFVTDRKEIRGVFVRYFKKLFSDDHIVQIQQIKDWFYEWGLDQGPKISDWAANTLKEIPDENEVTEVLFKMGPDKAPGPDGINTRFLQTNWAFLKGDGTSIIQNAFVSAQLPKDLLKSVVILIPKTNDPKTSKDYRPITLGNTIYRLIMKIISERLKPYIPLIISENRSAFIKGRGTMDNIILVREIMHSFELSSFQSKAFMMKADISKAFY